MSHAAGVLANRRVIIVEDEALIAFTVEQECRMLGCAATYIAYHKQQALDTIADWMPDFAVIDVCLTHTGSDLDIADRLAEHGVPFIFSSGHLARELPERHAWRPYVGKPMQQKEFIEAVKKALEE